MTNVYLVSLLLLTVLPALCIGVLWIAQQYHQFNTLTEKNRQQYLAARKQYVQDHVDEIYSQIEQHRSQRAAFIRSTLRTRAIEGYRLLETLRDMAGDDSRSAVLGKAAQALYATRFYAESHGRFWLLDLESEALYLSSQRSSIETENFPLDRILSYQQQQSEGYLDFSDETVNTGQPVELSSLHSAYYKTFAPLNIVVLAVEPSGVTEGTLRHWMLNVLQNTRYDFDRSVPYILNQSGEILAHPSHSIANQSIKQEAQESGSSQALLNKHQQIAQNNADGDFLEFRWHNTQTGQLSHGISFVRAFPDWGWIIGSGFFLDDFEQQIQIQQEQMWQNVIRQLAFAAIGLVIILMFAIWLAKWLSRRTATGFRQFNKFFNDANRISSYIDKKTLPYSEFSELADQANAMIKERTRYEKALLDSEHRFQLALRHAQHYLWDIHVDQRYISMSTGFFESLGYTRNDIDFDSLETIFSLCHPDDLATIKSEQLLYTIQKGGLEIRLRDKQGHYRWFFGRGSRVQATDEESSGLRLLGIVTEVTQRKTMEEELVTAHIAAEGASYAKSQFLATMSHELRTPLNGVLGYAQLLLQHDSLNKEQRQYVQSIADCGEHLLVMIGDILELSKLSGDRQQTFAQECWLTSLCQSVSDTVAEKARLKGLIYSWQIDDDVPQYVEVDSTKLKQILVSLLINAVKFTNEGWVKLSVHSDSQQQHLLFVVADSGIGIAPEQLQSIFEPFNQLDGAVTEGTGLGLALSKRIAEAIGGDIQVASQLHEGSQFRLRIPLKAVATPETMPAITSSASVDEPAQPPLKTTGDIVLLKAEVRQQLVTAIKQGDVEVLSRILHDMLAVADSPEFDQWLRACLENLERFDIDAVEQMIATATQSEVIA